MSKIIRLAVSNLLRLTAAEVTPDGNLVIVAGDNAQGKSSLLNSIAIALSGKNHPAKPIHAGASKGSVVLETEDLIVTRTFSNSGSNTLEVRNREGAKLNSPQQLLDRLLSLRTFDPLSFVRMDGDKQMETVRQIAGLDFADIDKRRQTAYDARTLANRDAKTAEGQLTGLRYDSTAPAQEVSVADLSTKLADAISANAGLDKLTEDLSDAIDDISSTEAVLDTRRDEMRAAEEALTKARENLDVAIQSAQAAVVRRDELKEKVDASAAQRIDVEAIRAEMTNADTINATVRANAAYKAKQQELSGHKAKSDSLTADIEKLDAEKERLVREGKFPIDGLGFTEGSVTFKGQPFAQISSSEQIRVSLAIANALNPELRVMLIRDGSLLDEKTLKLVADFAEKNDCQVFMECVGQREDASVIIEDGRSIEPPKKEGKKPKPRG